MLRRERFEIDIDASREEVWERLTTAEGLASWFGTRAEIDLRIEGVRIVGWGDRMEFSGSIAEIEAGRRLRVVYLADGEESGAEEWLIAREGGVTRLTLIQSMSDEGVDDWEGFFGDIRRGWRLFMASLRHGLEGAVAPDRHAECVYIPAPIERDEVWDRIGAVITRSPLTEGLETALEMPPHSRLLVARDRTLLLDAEGAGEAQVLYAQAATHGRPDDSVEHATWRRHALDLADAALPST